MQALPRTELNRTLSALQMACDMLCQPHCPVDEVTIVLPLVTGQPEERSLLKSQAAHLAEEYCLDAKFEYGPTSVTVFLSPRLG